jgi:hypothetical protein
VNAAAGATPAEPAAPTCGDDLCRLGDDVWQVNEVLAAELALVCRLQLETVHTPAGQRARQDEPGARDADGYLCRLAADESRHVFPFVGGVLPPPAGAQRADDVGVPDSEQLGELTLIGGGITLTAPLEPAGSAGQGRLLLEDEAATERYQAALDQPEILGRGHPRDQGIESSRPHAGQTLPT